MLYTDFLNENEVFFKDLEFIINKNGIDKLLNLSGNQISQILCLEICNIKYKKGIYNNVNKKA